MYMAQAMILVVEDNGTEQFALKHLLKRLDFHTHIVDSGEEAITAFGLEKYEAVLMNVTLPGMDGFECARRIRQMELTLGRRTPIIALTARTVYNDHENAMQAGMDAYLTKPIDREEFRRVLLSAACDSRLSDKEC
jgi:CheY-like chemotaxis protein